MENKWKNKGSIDSEAFVRTFRWILKGKYFNSDYINRVDFDFTKKIIILHVYEITKDGKLLIEEWTNKLISSNDEVLTFQTFSGKGDVLYQHQFSGLTIENIFASFDYEISDPAIRKITIKYEDLA